MLSPSMFESQLSQIEQKPITEDEIIKLLTEMIRIKRENNYLKKEVKLLEIILTPINAIEPMINYNKKHLLVESEMKQNTLNQFIPVNGVEAAYRIDNPYMKKGRRRRINKNKNNLEEV